MVNGLPGVSSADRAEPPQHAKRAYRRAFNVLISGQLMLVRP
jgi:hypothetical protein